MSVLPPCLVTKPTFPYVRNSSRDSHVHVGTNPNKEWVLPLPFSLFPYQSLISIPKSAWQKTDFFWAKACLSHTWLWLESLQFSEGRSLYRQSRVEFNIQLHLPCFHANRGVPLSRILGLKPIEVWVEIVSATFLVHIFLFLLQDVFLHWKMIETVNPLATCLLRVEFLQLQLFTSVI